MSLRDRQTHDRKVFAPAHQKAGEFSLHPTSFNVYHRAHRTMPTTPQGGIPAEPCAPVEHSSESGSEKQGKTKHPDQEKRGFSRGESVEDLEVDLKPVQSV